MVDTKRRDVAQAVDGFQTREFTAASLRAAANDDTSGREFTGIAVPFDDEIELWPGLRESVAPGAITSSDGKLFWRHREIIGRIPAHRDTAEGWEIDAVISDTTMGRDAATLLRDGAVDRLSIGFEPIEWSTTDHEDGTTTIRYTAIRVREVSLVPHPAYDNATINHIREEQPDMTDKPDTPGGVDINALALDLADLKRSMSTIAVIEPAAAADSRTAGQLLRAAAVDKDETAMATLQRAYDGGTSADDFGNATWIGDLSRLIDEADELDGVFSTGTLPDTGMTLEYGQLNEDNTTVAKQAAEGDEIVRGNLSVTTETVPVETYAGGASLTIQEIKRSQAPLLDMHLRALALKAGSVRADVKLEAVNDVITAATDPLTVPASYTWADWVDPMVAAVQRIRRLGLALQGLLLPSEVWIEMAKWEDADGRPILTPATDARDVGTFAVRNLDGRLLQLPTRMVSDLAAPAFYNSAAIRHYTAPVVRLTDTEIFTLSEDIAVYQFGAVAPEIPAAIVPVEIA